MIPRCCQPRSFSGYRSLSNRALIPGDHCLGVASIAHSRPTRLPVSFLLHYFCSDSFVDCPILCALLNLYSIKLPERRKQNSTPPCPDHLYNTSLPIITWGLIKNEHYNAILDVLWPTTISTFHHLGNTLSFRYRFLQWQINYYVVARNQARKRGPYSQTRMGN